MVFRWAAEGLVTELHGSVCCSKGIHLCWWLEGCTIVCRCGPPAQQPIKLAVTGITQLSCRGTWVERQGLPSSWIPSKWNLCRPHFVYVL